MKYLPKRRDLNSARASQSQDNGGRTCRYKVDLFNYLVVVEVLGFGAVCIRRSVPTFRRNILSQSSEAEVIRQGVPCHFIP
jgi:hypothetical protein